jgi:putative ABC transport system substrate-binding protein
MRVGRARLIVAFAFGLFPWSLAAHSQQTAKVPLIGILSDESPSVAAKALEPFVQGLRNLGWIEGQNITVERRYASGNPEILPSLAADLVSLQPDVIFATGTLAARAAKSATQTIPIVFAPSGDPVGYGLVPSLSRPSGNLTGLSLQLLDTAAKRLEFLVTAVPEAKRVGALWDASYPTAEAEFRVIEPAARSLNVVLIPADVRSPEDFEPALRALAEQGAAAVINISSPPTAMPKLYDLLVKARLPSMCWARPVAAWGCLMSYGPSYLAMWRRAAAYLDKILKGAKPADLPVEQPMKFELVINLKTAKALGLELPYTLVGIADEVIE